jgi:hypothetical protein
VTIMYKVMYKAAPFPNEDSVAAFKQSFTASSMLAATGLNGSKLQGKTRGAAAEASFDLALGPAAATLLNAGGCLSGCVYGIVTGILDAFPPAPGTKPPSVLTRGAFVAEVLAQFCSFPWFYSSGGIDCSSTEGRGRWLWLYTSCGVILDGVFIYKEDSMPENWDDKGVYIGFAYGVGHLAMAISASVGQDSLGQASCILPTISELAKPLRLTRVVTATKGISLPVLGVIDGVFGISSAITGFAATQRDIKTGPTEATPDVLHLLGMSAPRDSTLAA